MAIPTEMASHRTWVAMQTAFGNQAKENRGSLLRIANFYCFHRRLFAFDPGRVADGSRGCRAATPPGLVTL